MKYSLNMTQHAIDDMQQSATYIATELCNPDAADALLDAAENAAHDIPKYPRKHPLVQDAFLAYFGIRFVIVKNYLLFFTIDETEKSIHVIRFLYAKTDWRSIVTDTVLEDLIPPE